MDSLTNAYRRFRRTVWPQQEKKFAALAESGQQPSVLVVACIDSRVDPAMIFDARPGEMLVVRNVANLVPPYAPDEAYHGTSAALEFGVRVLNVPCLIVLGHSACGGVRALLDGAPAEAQDFVAGWMSMAAPARQIAHRAGDGADMHTVCEQEVVRLSLRNLLTFPWISDAVAAGRLEMVGAWFSIDSGTLSLLQPDGSFKPVADA